GRDRVRAARAVLVAERLDVVAGLAERGRRRCTGQTGTDDDDVQLAAVGRVDQAHVGPVLVPTFLDGAVRCGGVVDVVADDVKVQSHVDVPSQSTIPSRIAQ